MAGSAPIDLGVLPRSATVDDDGRLRVGGCDVADLAAEFGTPLYLYDEGELRARCREYADAFGGANVSYASKAFLCTAMAQLVAEEGLQLEVASGGEAFVALRAGFPAARISMHGNNKSDDEVRLALTEGFGRIVVDSTDELDRIERLVGGLVDEGLPAPSVLLRVTPGVEAHTHEYIATGADDSKFGITVSSGAARDAALRVVASDAMHLAGFHCHIGSQIFALESYTLAAEIVARLAAEVRDATGHTVEEINLGGGLAVPYTADDLDAPAIAEFGAALRDGFAHACAAAGLAPAPRLCVEAGRSIAAPSGMTLYTVGTLKDIDLGGGRHHSYVAVDGGMGDNPRPALYSAVYEAFLPARAADERPFGATVAGRHCEQGDLLVQDAQLPDGVGIGDVLATPVTGAYSHSMASTYNHMPRPAVVFVYDGTARVVVRRETHDDLVARDENLVSNEGD